MTTKARQKPSKDERYRNEVFPDSENLVFDARTKGFVPLPIVFRSLLRYVTPPELRVLIYLHLRTGREGICYPTVEEIAHDVGVSTPKHVRAHIRELEKKGFMRSGTRKGRVFYLIHDPAVAIRQLFKLGLMSKDELRDINGLREDLGHDPVQVEGDGSK